MMVRGAPAALRFHNATALHRAEAARDDDELIFRMNDVPFLYKNALIPDKNTEYVRGSSPR
jgi:hypothetical protein